MFGIHELPDAPDSGESADVLVEMEVRHVRGECDQGCPLCVKSLAEYTEIEIPNGEEPPF